MPVQVGGSLSTQEDGVPEGKLKGIDYRRQKRQIKPTRDHKHPSRLQLWGQEKQLFRPVDEKGGTGRNTGTGYFIKKNGHWALGGGISGPCKLNVPRLIWASLHEKAIGAKN